MDTNLKEIVNSLASIESLLLSQKTTFNLKDFCDYTGLSSSFAYKLTAGRKIRFSCPNGKLIFFKKEDVDAYLMSNPKCTIEDIEQSAINYVTRNSWKQGGRNV